MRIIPDEKLKEQLVRIGLDKLCKGYDISYDDYIRFLNEAEMLHPSYSKEAKHRWAAYSSLFRNKKYVKIKNSRPRLLFWVAFIVLLIAAFILIELLNTNAFAQGTSQLDFIKFEESDGTAIKTFASPFRFRCGTNFTCTSSGSRITIELTSLTGLENWTRNSGSGLLYPTSLTDKVGIGLNNPAVELDVLGRMKINTNAESVTISTRKGTNSTGYNLWIGNGGDSAIGAIGEEYKGSYNLSIGNGALYYNTIGYSNTAIGTNALISNTEGAANFAAGISAAYSNQRGTYNIAIGGDSLFSNVDGSLNLAVGAGALYNITTSYNAAIGTNAGRYLADGSSPNTTGSNSVFIGNATKASADGETNQIVIGDSAVGLGANKAVIGNSSTTGVYRYNVKLVEETEIRTRLSSNTTFYVRTDGSDSNDCSADDAAHACLTPQYAIDYLNKNIDAAGYNITVQIGDGTYSGSYILTIGSLPINVGTLTIQGNVGTPSNVLFDATGDTISLFDFANVNAKVGTPPAETGLLTIKGIKLASSTRNLLYIENAWVAISDIDCGSAAWNHFRIARNGLVSLIGDYTISGDAYSHYDIEYRGYLTYDDDAGAITVTASGARAFTTFAYVATGGSINLDKDVISFAGTITGTRFELRSGGSIATDSGGVDFLPGNSAGTNNGGFYDGVFVSANVRERITSAPTYYVRVDGSDSNTCLVDSAAGACLTVQGALDKVAAVDCAGYNVTIQIRDGTYTDPFIVSSMLGSGTLTIQGNSVTPSNVIISVSTSHAIIVQSLTNIVTIKDLKITTSGGFRHELYVRYNATAYFQNIDFGAATGFQIYTGAGAKAYQIGNYSITGGAFGHIGIEGFSFGQISGYTVTITGSPAFTYFAYASSGFFYARSTTYVGAATGQRYLAQLNGIIDTNGGGAAYLPGDVAGGTATGGQYI